MVKMKLHGFRELEKALVEELPKATARNVLTRTAINSMKRMQDKMAKNAPREHGDLAESMTTARMSAVRDPGSPKFPTAKGVGVLTGPAPQGVLNRSNASWQEFGTVKMSPNSYARPAADSEGQNVINEVREELTLQVEKAKARIARKAAKGV